jgi:hypothetical protein
MCTAFLTSNLNDISSRFVTILLVIANAINILPDKVIAGADTGFCKQHLPGSKAIKLHFILIEK